MARHMARSAVVCGVLTIAAIGFDRTNSLEVFAAAWPWRCVVGLICAGVAVCGFRSRNAMLTGLAYGAAANCIMAVIEFAGVAGPPATQENYMFASIGLFAICIVAVPIPFAAGLATCLVAAILHPSLPILLGSDASHFISDSIIGSTGTLTTLLLIRKNEVDRRRRFLERLRYENAAAELRLANLELHQISNTDALTGLPNRRSLEADAARLYAERTHQGVGAILIDVDHFKMYNDTAGHIAGDVCLRTVAQALARKAQERGVSIARYGGEEFAAVVPSGTPSELALIGEELRLAVCDVGLPHPGLPGRHVSISVGLTWQSEFANDPQALLQEADRALYAAKAAGRNRVAWISSGPSTSPGVVPAQVARDFAFGDLPTEEVFGPNR
jgi:diguanylate cyclase (GGDEF)-like protein